MSCGNHHDVDCVEVLERMAFFLDHELAEADTERIQQHLDECGPCLSRLDMERVVKHVVARSCTEHAPEHLRESVLVRIREVRIQITETP
jgi:mycothiol system anti-sigma-R factor